jgi:hypothetical protein
VTENSAAESLGKLGLGLGVGAALYFFITGLGFGGRGRGRGEGRGEGRDVSELPVPPVTPPVPVRPRDEKRLNFLLSTRGFELRDENWKPTSPAKSYSLEEVIFRVKEGGRSDLALKASGAVIQGAYDSALERLKQAGIVVWKVEAGPVPPPPVRASGNMRGQYGARWGIR